MSVTEFCLTVLTLLSLKRSSDDLQADLFDLMGFERFELIQLLLEHRDELIKFHAQQQKDIQQEIIFAATREYPMAMLDGVLSESPNRF